MSMKDYSVEDYGLLLTRETMKYLASKTCDDYSDEGYKEDEFGFNEEVIGFFAATYISDFTGEAVYLNDEGNHDWLKSDDYNEDYIYYIPTNRCPTLFKAAYKNMEELIDEFKEKIGKYLPSDFDYKNNIRHITGTYFG